MTVFVSEHKVVGLIVIAICIALVSTTVGMMLYSVTGTAQLDLSRPGYEGVGKVVSEDTTVFTEYPATGAMNEKALSEFDALYKDKLNNLKSVDAFGGDPMALDVLGLDEEVQADDVNAGQL